MKPYLVTYEFYYDDERKDYQTHVHLLDSPHNEEIVGSDFNSLLELKLQYGPVVPLTLWCHRKGKALYWPDSFIGIKEWKNNCKPWKLVISSEETTISMKRLMDFKTEDVIQYLKERGITTCPMNF